MGECFFWYRPTRVVPDKRPLNGCVCVCVCVCVRVCVWVLYDRNCKQCLGDIVKSAGYLHSLLPRHLVNTFVRYSSVGGVRRL